MSRNPHTFLCMPSEYCVCCWIVICTVDCAIVSYRGTPHQICSRLPALTRLSPSLPPQWPLHNSRAALPPSASSPAPGWLCTPDCHDYFWLSCKRSPLVERGDGAVILSELSKKILTELQVWQHQTNRVWWPCTSPWSQQLEPDRHSALQQSQLHQMNLQDDGRTSSSEYVIKVNYKRIYSTGYSKQRDRE